VTVRGANLPIELVWASRGKHTRAEPISDPLEPAAGARALRRRAARARRSVLHLGAGRRQSRSHGRAGLGMTDLFPNEEPTPKGVLALGAARGAWGGGRGKR
jgi:hypothetical protein